MNINVSQVDNDLLDNTKGGKLLFTLLSLTLLGFIIYNNHLQIKIHKHTLHKINTNNLNTNDYGN